MKESVSNLVLSIRSRGLRFILKARLWISGVGLLPVVGAFVIGIIVLITYYPDLTAGFWTDDFHHLQYAGSPSWSDFLARVFDPRFQSFEYYRPMLSLQWRIQYVLLGSDALWYHVIQNSVHLLNCVLLFAIIGRLSRNWRMGFIGALVYSALPAFSISVFWVGVQDPLAAFFYSLAIWLWIDYLEEGSRAKLVLTFLAFVFGLLTKEIDLTLPITLLLVDRWLVAKPARLKEWAARNASFFLVLPFWTLLDWNVLVGKLATAESYRADWGAILSTLISYVSVLTLPWSTDSVARYLALLMFLGLLAYVLVARKYRLLFLGVVGPLSVIPMAGGLGVDARYLYLPLMVSAAWIGIIVEDAYKLVRLHSSKRAMALLACSALALSLAWLTVSESTGTAEAAQSFAANASQSRLEFRPVYQQHPSFEPDTLLYFVEPPLRTFYLSGMMFLRYGTNVIVEGNEYAGLAGLREHKAAFVFFQDEQGILREQQVDPEAVITVSPALPVQFGPSLRLDGFEVVNTKAKPGQAIVLLLYWRAQGQIDKNYTVFAHLLDKSGAIVASHDSQPHRGAWPMTLWQTGALVEDAVILPIGPDVPLGGDYHIEVGVYYLPTMERLPLIEGSQVTGRDSVIFDSFAVER